MFLFTIWFSTLNTCCSHQKADAVTTVKIANDAITTDLIAASAITATELGADAVTSAKIADNAITSAAIAADAITTAKIADNAIRNKMTQSEIKWDNMKQTKHMTQGNSIKLHETT